MSVKSTKKADVWRTLETLRSQLNNNSTSNSTLNDKCICLEAFLDQIELCQETERGALITSLASGRFWIQFCENYLENKEKSEEHLLSCSSLFELLIRYKCVLLLGIKLVGFQKFKQLFYSIFDMEMTRVGLLLRTAQYVFILVDELYWSLRRILLIVLHLIRTLFDINDLSHSRRLQELNITIALQQLFTMLGQDKTGLVEDCLEDHEELLWACVRLINVTICITLQRPKMFFEQKGLLESFLVFVAMVSRVQLQKFSYDLPNTTQITYLRVLRKREKEEEEEEQQQQQKQKQKQQQPKGQEQNENKANAKIDNSSSLQLSNFYSSLTQSLMSCSSDISDDSMRHLARFILTLTLFLRVFESSMKSSLSENTKCLALVLKDLLCLIIRYEVLNFWNGQNRSKTSAVYIVTKIVALKELLNWVENFDETKLNESARSWIKMFEKDVPSNLLTPMSRCIDEVKDICFYDIVSCQFEYGNVNICFNPSCSVGVFDKKKDVERCQSSTSNRIVRFLQRNPLNIQEPLDFPILQKCSGCFLAQYCSDACQKQDWTRHKSYCKETYEARSKFQELKQQQQQEQKEQKKTKRTKTRKK